MTELTERVDIKSAWLSKVNWTQAVSIASSVAVVFGLDVPPETQAHIVVGINAAAGVVTWIMKTWFTTTLTPSSAARV